MGEGRIPLGPWAMGVPGRSAYGLEGGLCCRARGVVIEGWKLWSWWFTHFAIELPQALIFSTFVLPPGSPPSTNMKPCWEGAALGWGLGEQELLGPWEPLLGLFDLDNPLSLSPGPQVSTPVSSWPKSRATPRWMNFPGRMLPVPCPWPTWSWGSYPSSAVSASRSGAQQALSQELEPMAWGKEWGV